ncbi:MAG: 3-oxoacyl-ACP reductase FabG [Pseudomonadota bacterium]
MKSLETPEKTPKKIAFITGASRGIGLAIAKLLAEKNHFVIATATTEDGANNLTAVLSSTPGSGIGVVLDLAEPKAEEIIQSIAKNHGRPDILVHNAGVVSDQLMMMMPTQEWRRVLNVNLDSFHLLVRHLTRGMLRQRWGRVIAVSSVVARAGNPGQTNYAASKAGLEASVRSLASEISVKGITVNSVAPGFIDTDMTRKLPDALKQQLLSNTPAGRFGSPEEIAQVVAFLASDAASYITGATIPVNGGLYMM